MMLVAAFFDKMYYCQCRLWQFMHSSVFTTYGFIYWCVALWLLLCCVFFVFVFFSPSRLVEQKDEFKNP